MQALYEGTGPEKASLWAGGRRKKTPVRAEESGAGAAANDAGRCRGRQGNPPAAPGERHAQTGGGAAVPQQNASESMLQLSLCK